MLKLNEKSSNPINSHFSVISCPLLEIASQVTDATRMLSVRLVYFVLWENNNDTSVAVFTKKKSCFCSNTGYLTLVMNRAVPCFLISDAHQQLDFFLTSLQINQIQDSKRRLKKYFVFLSM